MSEEETKINEKQPTPDASAEAKVVSEMKSRLDALQAENASLKKAKSEYYDKVLNDQKLVEKPIEIKEIKDEKKLAQEFSDIVSAKSSNLETAKKIVEIDEWYRENKGESVFLPHGREVQVTENERATADRVHDALKTCIEASEGNPTLFNAKLAEICPGRFPDKTGKK